MSELQAHKVNQNTKSQVEVESKFSSDLLVVSFKIKTPHLNTSNEFSSNKWNNWGLWDYDVAEVFIQKEDSANHYLELQISPLGQKFALLVQKPREIFERVEDLPVVATSQILSDGFSANFEIPLSIIPGDGPVLKGNFHACLGPSNQREYFSLILNPEDQPDFHRPEFFQKLGEIS